MLLDVLAHAEDRRAIAYGHLPERALSGPAAAGAGAVCSTLTVCGKIAMVKETMTKAFLCYITRCLRRCKSDRSKRRLTAEHGPCTFPPQPQRLLICDGLHCHSLSREPHRRCPLYILDTDLVPYQLTNIVHPIPNHRRSLQRESPSQHVDALRQAHGTQHLWTEHATVSNLHPLA